MAPAYKLLYFNIRALAEPVRFLLKYGGIEFEDVRIDQEDWPQLKESILFGQLPLLEHNGVQMGQSVALARYAGKLVKLAGNSDWENLEIDAVVDTINDFRLKLKGAYTENDKGKKNAVINETVPYYYSRLDAIVQKNKGYLALERLTWADFYFVSLIPLFDYFLGSDVEKLIDQYPNLKSLQEKISSFPAIKRWIEIRPKTDY